MEHQGCVLPLNQHKDKRFFLVSNMLILSFISGAEMAKWCISTASPVTQLPTYIARLCALQQCQLPMSPPVAVTHVRCRWSHKLTGQTQKFILKIHQTGQLVAEASPMRPSICRRAAFAAPWHLPGWIYSQFCWSVGALAFSNANANPLVIFLFPLPFYVLQNVSPEVIWHLEKQRLQQNCFFSFWTIGTEQQDKHF